MNRNGWTSFTTLCSITKRTETLSEVLDIFLTMKEKADISLRCLIIKHLLENKKTQRELAKELNVSIAKITRGSNELKRLDPQLIAYLKKHFKTTS